jgi:hypothetical protein
MIVRWDQFKDDQIHLTYFIPSTPAPCSSLVALAGRCGGFVVVHSGMVEFPAMAAERIARACKVIANKRQSSLLIDS